MKTIRYRMNRTMILAIGAMGFGIPSTRAAQIAGWDFSPILATSNWGASPYATTSADPNVTVVGLTRNWTTGTGTPAAAGWGGNNFSLTANTEAAAITANNTATFSLTAKAGWQLSISDIPAYNIRRSASGPSTGIWQYQVGSGSFTDIGSPITWGSTTTAAGNAQSAITLSGITALQNVAAGTVVTFRLVTWGATTAGGTWYLNDPAKTTAIDFAVNGTVIPAVNTYTVTYDGNGSTGGSAPVDGNNPYSSGATVTVLGNTGSLARTGYSFSGWNTAADGSGTTYSAGGSFTIASNTTLYAKWTNVPTNPTATATADYTDVLSGQSVTLTVTVTPGQNPTSTGIAVTSDLSALGGSATQMFSAGAGNTFRYTIPANLAVGPTLLNFSVVDAQNRTATASLTLNIHGNLTIFHTNDTHARVTPHKWIVPQHTLSTAANFEDVGGISYMGGKVLSLTAATPDALVLDGGDISEGNPIGDWNGPGNTPGSFGDGTIVDYFKMLDTKLKAIAGRGGRGLDAMVVGNHDIRDITYLNNMKAASAQFPILSINICNKGTHTPYYQAYTIVNVNGNKIGIVGYTTESADSPETAVNNLIDVVGCDWSSTDSTKIHFADIVNDLRNNQGCNLVILLTHMGHSGLCTVTSANPTPILVDNAAAKLPEVVVSGHWHTYCDTVWQPSALNYKTIFTEAGSFQHYVGELKINGAGQYVSSNYHPLRNSSITPDADIASYLQTRKDQYAATNPTYGVDQILGYTADNLLLDNYMKWWSADEYPWSGNNTAGNWICDAVQWKAAALFGQCDLSLEAGGGVRSDIVAGPIKYTNIYETFPQPSHRTGVAPSEP